MVIAPARPRPATPEAEEFRFLLRNCRAQRRRTMREFAEQEIWLPASGPFPNLRYRCERQPYSALYFDQVEKIQFAGWRVISASGPSQSGKTLTCTVIPLLYHLFEMRETVIFGLPDKDMAADKWSVDILPVLERTKYIDQLPKSNGPGSRGGRVVDSIRFRDGQTLKFMSAGGDDKERSAFTSRVLIVTEVNAFRKMGEASREANKYAQLCARIQAFDDRGIIYQECTEEDEESISWQAYQQGTTSRIVSPCPHCGHFVSPDREQLRGWQTASDELEAKMAAAFVCPREECGEEITDPQRREMLKRAKLIHRGQSIDQAGKITGDPPRTTTLGFRWTAFDNLLMKTGTIAVEEYKAARAVDEQSAEKKMCQFYWARPYQPDITEAVMLNANAITMRTMRWARGVIPAGAKALTVGIDLGLHLGHYLVVAWFDGFAGHVVDYGRFDVPGRDLGPDRAIELALRQLHDTTLAVGWRREEDGEAVTADMSLIDCGYQQDAVFRFLHSHPPEVRQHYRAAKGYGAGKFRAERYRKPKSTSNAVLAIGEGYHLAKYADANSVVFEFSANFWKSFLHARLATALQTGVITPGALSLFATSPREHLTIAKHFTAEKRVIEYVEGEGNQEVWHRVHKNNHWLDCGSQATAAAHWLGLRFVPPAADPTAESPTEEGITMPDGRPFYIGDRYE
jgi:phage terminase large subunit GpA-like protein